VDAVLTKVRRKYKEYGINEKPFVVVKGGHSGSGSPGVVTVRDAKDVEALIGKPRGTASSAPAAKTGAGRELREPTELIVQEGVLTNERVHNGVAEPVVYMMDRYVVGGFYRVHAERAADENLKLPGASFVPLAFSESAHLPQPGAKPGASAPNRFYMYGVVGRLAMVAASYEMEATDPDAEIYE
jgi:glutamate--cysteine ligase